MKKQIKSMEQLRDSRLMFDKKLPSFGYALIIIIALSMIAITVWSVFSYKNYIVVSQGVVTSNESNYVMPAYGGIIEASYMYEGKVVKEGDVLFTVKSTDYNLQEEQLLYSKAIYEEKVIKLNLLVKSIKDDKNYFDSSNTDDIFYYSSYENYKAQVAQNTIDVNTYKSYGYSEELIEQEVKKNEAKISEIYHSTLTNVEMSIEDVNTQIAAIEAQLLAIKKGQAEYCVKANNSGVLHMMADYKEGMVVQAGNAIASITAENSDIIVEAYISTADRARIKENDTVQLAVDGLMQSVYGNISGVVVSIDRNITSMEGSNGQSNNVFRIKIKPNNSYVIGNSGDKVNLSNGMSVEARITYNKVTYFQYLLEKLGLYAR